VIPGPQDPQFEHLVLTVLQESSPDGVLVVDEMRRWVLWNTRFVDMWGLPPDVVESRSSARALEFVRSRLKDPVDFEARVLDYYRNSRAKGVDLVEMSDGRVFERHTEPLVTPDGHLRGRLWFFRDVSSMVAERDQAQRHAYLSELRLRTIIEATPDLLFRMDRAGNYRDVMGATGELMLPPSRIVGRNIRDMGFPAPTVQTILACIGSALDTGTIQSSTYSLQFQGMERHYEARYVKIDSEEAVAIVRETTQQVQESRRARQLEASLIQAQKMEAIGTLAGGIAHDFNNILTAIIGNASLVKMGLSPTDPAAGPVEEILFAGQRAQTIIRRILTFSRHEEPQRSRVSLSAVTRDTLNMMAATLPSGVRIESDCGHSGHLISGDAGQIHQVVLNLCTNGVQAMENRGVLSVSVATVSVDAPLRAVSGEVLPGRYERLRVADTGPGMDEATAARIFEPFFTTKAHGAGTGLGLAIVHGVVNNHGAFMRLDTAPGSGARFEIYFQPLPGEPASPEHPVPPGPSARKILLVDDDPSVARLGRQLLETLGYKVNAFTSPVLALDGFLSDPDAFAALVTDYSMPGMNGLDLAAHMRERRPSLPVVVLTGYGTPATQARARTMGIGPLLGKPFSASELARAIQGALSS